MASAVAVTKLGQMELEESRLMNLINYHTPVYCVLMEDKVMKYYRNRNDYYLSLRRNNNSKVMGFINLSPEYARIGKVGDDSLQISMTVDHKTKTWKFRLDNTKLRDEWFDAIHSTTT